MRCLFRSTFFPVLQTNLQDCGKQHLPVFDVVLEVRMGVCSVHGNRLYQPFGSSALNQKGYETSIC